MAKSKMAAILSEKSKNSHEIWTNWPRMAVLESIYRIIKSRININTKKMYAKYLVAESKMGAISNENIPKYLIRYELMELEWWS